MVNWKAIDPATVEAYCKQTFERYGVYPSVRDIFYHFIDKLWPNTKSVYKALSKWLVTQRLTGKIAWQMVRDGGERKYETGDYIHDTPKEHLTFWLDIFTDVGSRYHLPMWLDQPKKVIVACEKESDYPIIKAILGDLNVDTFYERGYSGWRPLFEATETIRDEQKTPIIIALGDFDPSGEDIVRFLRDAFIQLGFEDIQVEKVVVTKEQVEKFELPHRPEDAGEIEKLKRDARFRKWPYGLYRVETAALRDKAPDFFDNVIRDAVKKHFNQETYDKIHAKQNELRKKIAEFFEDHSDLIDELRDAIGESEMLEG